jgi:hypothetical protein
MILSYIENQRRKTGEHVLYYFSGPLYPWLAEKAEREELKGTDKKHIYLARAESWNGGAAGLNYMHRYLPYKKPARHLP